MAAVLVVHDSDAPAWLAERTLRALSPAGRARAEVVLADDLASALRRVGPRAFVLRAGTFGASVEPPRPSATGLPLLALGATRGDAAWAALLADTGGVLRPGLGRGAAPPSIDALYTEDPVALSAALGALVDLSGAVHRLVDGGAHRTVRIPTLDVGFSRTLRVLQLVTSLHRGGAERVALDLTSELPRFGISARLAVLDAPRREAYPEPPALVRLDGAARDRAGRVAAAAAFAQAEGFDLVHAHLLARDELAMLGEGGLPVVTTLHNALIGLPPGVATLGQASRLAIACSRGVAGDVPSIGTPLRVAWNGIAVQLATKGARARVRASLGLADRDDALVLLAIANPRTQKRLERSVAVLAALRARAVDAHLVIAGAPLVTSDDARGAAAKLDQAIVEHEVSAAVHRLGSRDDVPDLCAAADVVLSTSAWEGLSLAHLEAVAAGRPLVATATHGTEEIARKHAGVVLVPLDAAPSAIADAVLHARRGGASGSPGTLAPDFTRETMAERTAELLARAVAPARDAAGPILLITNNLSVGGAQTSARRLLTELARRGERVAAIVVEEQPDHPTPGRTALRTAGVDVTATTSLRQAPTDVVFRELLREIDARRPSAVLFWNLVAELRVRVADALLGTPCFDVSPGEMSYASLERYLARPRVGHPVITERDYGRLLAGVIAKYEGERARAARLGAPVTVIPNGVVVPEIAPPLPVGGPRVVLGTLARIAPHKRIEDLIDAVAALPPDEQSHVELRVAGPTELGAEAYERELTVRAQGLPIRFVGETDAASLLSEIELFVMVSEPAGCPNASLEAMAHGRAVVATDVGGAAEQLTSHVGRLVAPRDPLALAEAITELARDRRLLERMGAAAHAHARDRFTVSRMADDYLRLCRARG
ncbi:MAG: glycosyltransferase family 4 protein [Polyangiaceae bacterium]